MIHWNPKRLIPFIILALAGMISTAHAQQFAARSTTPHPLTQDWNLQKVGNYYYSIQWPDMKVGADFGMLNPGIAFKAAGVGLPIVLYRYDSAMKQVNQQLLFKDKPHSGPFSPTLWSFNERLYLFYFTQENKKAPVHLIQANIDATTLLPADTKKLAELDPQVVNSIGTAAGWMVARPVLAVSPDQSKVLLSWATNGNNEFLLQAFNRDMQPLWQAKEAVAGTGKIEEFNACIDNEGKAYACFMKWTNKEEWIYPVYVYGEKGKLKELEVKTSERRLYQANLIPAIDGQTIHIAGTYSAIPHRITGLFHQTLSITGLAIQKNATYPFTEILIQQLDKDTWASTKEKNYGLEKIFFQNHLLADGSLTFVGEFRRNGTNTVGPRNLPMDYAISGSIVHAVLKNDKADFYYVPKYRVSAAKNIGDSYAAIPYNNRLYIFYDDQPAHLEKDINLPANQSNVYIRSVLVVAYLDAQGKMTRKALIDQTKEDFMPVGDMAIPLTPSRVILPSYKLNGVGRLGKERILNVVDVME